MKKQENVKRNYLKELKDEDILKLLQILNYNLQPFLTDRQTGEFLPAIERNKNE